MILEVLSQYYDWTPNRRVSPTGWTKVRCPNPDHDDSIDSATVSVEFEYVKCFACGFGQHAIQIVMDQEEVSRDDALAILSEIDPTGTGTLLSQSANGKSRRRVFGDREGARSPRDRAVRPRLFRDR